MTTYIATAEHTKGKSVGHPCTHGVYEDPTDSFGGTIEATSEEDAEQQAWEALLKIVADAEPCNCQRKLCPGNDFWVDSVVIHLEKSAD